MFKELNNFFMKKNDSKNIYLFLQYNIIMDKTYILKGLTSFSISQDNSITFDKYDTDIYNKSYIELYKKSLNEKTGDIWNIIQKIDGMTKINENEIIEVLKNKNITNEIKIHLIEKIITLLNSAQEINQGFDKNYILGTVCKKMTDKYLLNNIYTQDQFMNEKLNNIKHNIDEFFEKLDDYQHDKISDIVQICKSANFFKDKTKKLYTLSMQLSFTNDFNKFIETELLKKLQIADENFSKSEKNEIIQRIYNFITQWKSFLKSEHQFSSIIDSYIFSDDSKYNDYMDEYYFKYNRGKQNLDDVFKNSIDLIKKINKVFFKISDLSVHFETEIMNVYKSLPSIDKLNIKNLLQNENVFISELSNEDKIIYIQSLSRLNKTSSESYHYTAHDAKIAKIINIINNNYGYLYEIHEYNGLKEKFQNDQFFYENLFKKDNIFMNNELNIRTYEIDVLFTSDNNRISFREHQQKLLIELNKQLINNNNLFLMEYITPLGSGKTVSTIIINHLLELLNKKSQKKHKLLYITNSDVVSSQVKSYIKAIDRKYYEPVNISNYDDILSNAKTTDKNFVPTNQNKFYINDSESNIYSNEKIVNRVMLKSSYERLNMDDVNIIISNTNYGKMILDDYKEGKIKEDIILFFDEPTIGSDNMTESYKNNIEMVYNSDILARLPPKTILTSATLGDMQEVQGLYLKNNNIPAITNIKIEYSEREKYEDKIKYNLLNYDDVEYSFYENINSYYDLEQLERNIKDGKNNFFYRRLTTFTSFYNLYMNVLKYSIDHYNKQEFYKILEKYIYEKQKINIFDDFILLINQIIDVCKQMNQINRDEYVENIFKITKKAPKKTEEALFSNKSFNSIYNFNHGKILNLIVISNIKELCESYYNIFINNFSFIEYGISSVLLQDNSLKEILDIRDDTYGLLYNHLYDYLLRGVGFMTTKFDKKYTTQVHKLLRNKQITILFGDDSVIYGMDYDVDKIYINSSYNKNHSVETMMQLIGRSGRQGKQGYIYISNDINSRLCDYIINNGDDLVNENENIITALETTNFVNYINLVRDKIKTVYIKSESQVENFVSKELYVSTIDNLDTLFSNYYSNLIRNLQETYKLLYLNLVSESDQFDNKISYYEKLIQTYISRINEAKDMYCVIKNQYDKRIQTLYNAHGSSESLEIDMTYNVNLNLIVATLIENNELMVKNIRLVSKLYLKSKKQNMMNHEIKEYIDQVLSPETMVSISSDSPLFINKTLNLILTSQNNLLNKLNENENEVLHVFPHLINHDNLVLSIIDEYNLFAKNTINYIKNQSESLRNMIETINEEIGSDRSYFKNYYHKIDKPSKIYPQNYNPKNNTEIESTLRKLKEDLKKQEKEIYKNMNKLKISLMMKKNISNPEIIYQRCKNFNILLNNTVSRDSSEYIINKYNRINDLINTFIEIFFPNRKIKQDQEKRVNYTFKARKEGQKLELEEEGEDEYENNEDEFYDYEMEHETIINEERKNTVDTVYKKIGMMSNYDTKETLPQKTVNKIFEMGVNSFNIKTKLYASCLRNISNEMIMLFATTMKNTNIQNFIYLFMNDEMYYDRIKIKMFEKIINRFGTATRHENNIIGAELEKMNIDENIQSISKCFDEIINVKNSQLELYAMSKNNYMFSNAFMTDKDIEMDIINMKNKKNDEYNNILRSLKAKTNNLIDKYNEDYKKIANHIINFSGIKISQKINYGEQITKAEYIGFLNNIFFNSNNNENIFEEMYNFVVRADVFTRTNYNIVQSIVGIISKLKTQINNLEKQKIKNVSNMITYQKITSDLLFCCESYEDVINELKIILLKFEELKNTYKISYTNMKKEMNYVNSFINFDNDTIKYDYNSNGVSKIFDYDKIDSVIKNINSPKTEINKKITSMYILILLIDPLADSSVDVSLKNKIWNLFTNENDGIDEVSYLIESLL